MLAFTAAFVVAFAEEELTNRLQAGAPAVKRWGGVVLIVVGMWFVALGVFANAFARIFPVRP